jgi:hypothetical protein
MPPDVKWTKVNPRLFNKYLDHGMVNKVNALIHHSQQVKDEDQEQYTYLCELLEKLVYHKLCITLHL